MIIFNKIKKKYFKNFYVNLPLWIGSLVIAIIAWFVISVSLYPSIPKTFTNVPLNLDISGTSAKANGLTLVSCDVSEVTVKLEGDRSQVGNLKRDDLNARLVINNIVSEGTRNLSIEVVGRNGKVFEVKEITPESAMVFFDKFETRTFNLTPEIPEVTFAPGTTVEAANFRCDPATIDITGPASQLDKIDKVIAMSNRIGEIGTTHTFDCDEIQLRNDSGAVISNEGLDIPMTSISITIPVLKQKTVDLSVQIVNTPANFNKDSLKFILSADKIDLASEQSTVDFPNTFDVAMISLSELDLDYSGTFRIDTKDLINQSNLETITVTLDSENLNKKDITISQLKVINPPSTHNFEVSTKYLPVTLIGPADIIKNITANDIVAEVNLLGLDIAADSFIYDVTISCITYDNVWAVGTYKATVFRTPKDD